MVTVRQALEAAVEHHRAGDLERAEQLYRLVLEAAPAEPDALHLLGLVLRKRGKVEEAVAYLEQAVRARPASADFHTDLGTALKAQGRLDEALASFRTALELRPDSPPLLNSIGNVQAAQGKQDEAVLSYREALRHRPDLAEAHNNLGTAYMVLGRAEEALACYREAVRFRPDFAEAHKNLGNALARIGRPQEALTSLDEAVRLQPQRAETHDSRGSVLLALGRAEEAVSSFQQALRLNPAFAQAHNNRGSALEHLDLPEQALASYREALRLRPDLADAHTNLASLLLLRGDFVDGWQEYEWRWKKRGPWSFTQPLWDGGPLEGRTILLHAEQGLGDTLQFVRYAALVKERGATVVLACQRALLRLLTKVRGVDALIAQGEPLPHFDVHAPLLSLPRLLGTTLDTVPAAVPYLFAEPERIQRWGRELPHGGVRIGIAWQGNSDYPRDHERSVPLREFAPLARVPGVQLISLQKGRGREQLAEVAYPIIDLGSRLDNVAAFVDTVAVLQHLDLVITSDSALPHLAGGLGVAVWMAVPLVPDWRWLLGREDSPWYPTMRLFRQHRRGDWVDVFERIAVALALRGSASGN